MQYFVKTFQNVCAWLEDSRWLRTIFKPSTNILKCFNKVLHSTLCQSAVSQCTLPTYIGLLLIIKRMHLAYIKHIQSCGCLSGSGRKSISTHFGLSNGISWQIL